MNKRVEWGEIHVEDQHATLELPRRRSFEYKDASGNKLCDVHISTVKTADEDEGYEDSLRLTKLELESPTGETVDFFKLMGLPEGCTVLMHEQSIESFNRRSATVRIQSIDSPMGLVILAHEIGHAVQHQERNYQGIEEWNGAHRWVEPTDANAGEVIDLVNTWVKREKSPTKVSPEKTLLFGEQMNQVMEARRVSVEASQTSEKAFHQLLERRDHVAALVNRFLQEKLKSLELHEEHEVGDLLAERGIEILGVATAQSECSREMAESLLRKTVVLQGKEIGKSLFITPGIDGIVGSWEMTTEQGERVLVTFSLSLADIENPYVVGMKKMRDQLQSLEKNAEATEAKNKEAKRQYENIVEANPDVVRHMLRMPTVILERDATRRALQTLRTLKQKHGIDFLRSLDLTEDQADEYALLMRRTALRDSLPAGTLLHIDTSDYAAVDAVEYLETCLDTYGATRAGTRRQYGHSPKVKQPPHE